MVKPEQNVFPPSGGSPVGHAMALIPDMKEGGHTSRDTNVMTPSPAPFAQEGRGEQKEHGQGFSHGPAINAAPSAVPQPSFVSGAHPSPQPQHDMMLSGEASKPEGFDVSFPPASPLPDYQQGGDFIAPAILIHAFCEGPHLADLIRVVQGDRRFRRPTIMCQMGGMQAALERYSHEATPDLLLIETSMVGPELFSQLDALASVCDERTRLVLVGVSNDVALYRDLIRRGVSDYLIQPLNPLQLIHAIAQLYKDPEQAFVGRSLAFLGTRGGVGSSTLCHNIAWYLAETAGFNTLLVDFDLVWGTAGLNLNQESAFGLAEAVEDPDNLDQTMFERLISERTERLKVLPAPANLQKSWHISSETAESIMAAARGFAPYVLLDLPHVWHDWLLNTLLDSDQIVLVATPDLASLRNTKNMLDILRNARKNEAPPFVILNQVNMPRRPEITVKDFSTALNIQPSLVIPFEPGIFGVAANSGQMLAEVNLKSPIVTTINNFSSTLVGRQESKDLKKTSLFDKILKRK